MLIMTKVADIEKRWIKTVRCLLVVDFVVAGVVVYLFVNRARGDLGFTSYAVLFSVVVVILLGNAILFWFMRKIKDIVKDIAKDD